MSKYGVISGPYFPAFGLVLPIFPYSVQLLKNADKNNSVFGYFSRSVSHQSFSAVFERGMVRKARLLMMLVFFKDVTDKNISFGALLADLSKASDCLCHDLLIAKLHAYGFDMSSLNLLYQTVSKGLK